MKGMTHQELESFSERVSPILSDGRTIIGGLKKTKVYNEFPRIASEFYGLCDAITMYISSRREDFAKGRHGFFTDHLERTLRARIMTDLETTSAYAEIAESFFSQNGVANQIISYRKVIEDLRKVIEEKVKEQ